MEIQPFTKDNWSLSPIVAEQVPWFKGREVATSLDYANPLKALRDHVDDEDKKPFHELAQGVNETFTPSNQQPHELYVNESGLYCLALRSNKPEAKCFRRWVTQVVLPSIRKYGHYGDAAEAGSVTTKLTEQLAQTLTTAVERGIERGVETALRNAENRTSERLSTIQTKLQQIPEYGPRLEMSRGFPAAPDELTSVGAKLEEEDEERIREFSLPTSTFLQEKFPGKTVARINSCFAKLLKKRRLQLQKQDPEANKIFLVYSQGAWRIAYFEDDRELMEEVLDSPAMRGTTQRLLGVDVPRKRTRTLDDYVE